MLVLILTFLVWRSWGWKFALGFLFLACPAEARLTRRLRTSRKERVCAR